MQNRVIAMMPIALPQIISGVPSLLQPCGRLRRMQAPMSMSAVGIHCIMIIDLAELSITCGAVKWMP